MSEGKAKSTSCDDTHTTIEGSAEIGQDLVGRDKIININVGGIQLGVSGTTAILQELSVSLLAGLLAVYLEAHLGTLLAIVAAVVIWLVTSLIGLFVISGPVVSLLRLLKWYQPKWLCRISLVILILLGGSVYLATRPKVAFYFENNSTDCWAIRTEPHTGRQLGQDLTLTSNFGHQGDHALRLEVELSHEGEHRAQIERPIEACGEIKINKELSAWIYIPPDAPADLEAELFVQDNRTETGTWYASNPIVRPRPGAWVQLTWNSRSDPPFGAWEDIRTFGIEVKTNSSYYGPLYIDEILIR